MTRQELVDQVRKKQSYLCVGLDTDPDKIPPHLHHATDPVFEFNKRIIDATLPYAVAYKPNVAFYEASGPQGWESLKRTVEYIPRECFTIADAKRGDIGNTAAFYARAFFKEMNFDAITVAPYMGEDSVRPFLEFKNKWAILLAHTSNPGSADFQMLESQKGRPLYEEVILQAQRWGTPENLMYVVGATQAERMKGIRAIAPKHFFLVPGVGAQGGSLEEVSASGLTSDVGLLVNSSRAIIYASRGEDFAVAAGRLAREMREKMSEHLTKIDN